MPLTHRPRYQPMSLRRANLLPHDEEYGGQVTLGEHIENPIGHTRGRAVVEGGS